MYWMNVYKVGVYHRAGKPEACDRHGGDIYASREIALRHIEYGSHYICTVAVPYIGEGEINFYPKDSQAVPLHSTRSQFEIFSNHE